MYDQLTASGRERWVMLLDEADAVRRARRVAPVRRVALRERAAATLVAVARRIEPATPVSPPRTGAPRGAERASAQWRRA